MSDVMQQGQNGPEPQGGSAAEAGANGAATGAGAGGPSAATPPPRPDLPMAPPPRPNLAPRLLPSEAADVERPPAVDLAYWAWLVAVIAALITAALTLTHWDSLHADMAQTTRDEFPDETQATIDKVATAALAVFIGAGVLFALLQMVFAMMMRRGRAWARWALVVFGLLSIVLAVLVAGASPGDVQIGLVVSAALIAAAGVAMFVPAANSWFRQHKDFSPVVGETY